MRETLGATTAPKDGGYKSELINKTSTGKILHLNFHLKIPFKTNTKSILSLLPTFVFPAKKQKYKPIFGILGTQDLTLLRHNWAETHSIRRGEKIIVEWLNGSSTLRAPGLGSVFRLLLPRRTGGASGDPPGDVHPELSLRARPLLGQSLPSGTASLSPLQKCRLGLHLHLAHFGAIYFLTFQPKRCSF